MWQGFFLFLLTTCCSADRPLLMVPGPIEYHEDVLEEMSSVSLFYVGPEFTEKFGSALDKTQEVLHAQAGQPFILAGAGSSGYDFIIINTLEVGKSALVISNGRFGDKFGDVLESYGMRTNYLRAPLGQTASLQEVEDELRRVQYDFFAMVLVETSTSVVTDVQAVSALARSIQPNILIGVDGVSAFGSQEFRFDDWGVDAILSGCQKTLGTPPGLMVVVLSQRALEASENRVTRIPSVWFDVDRILPIMKSYQIREPLLYSTPPINTINAYEVSLTQLINYGLDEVVENAVLVSRAMRSAFKAMNLQLIADESISANTITSVMYPPGIGIELLDVCESNGLLITTGAYLDVEYFRVSHMGISARELHREHLQTTIRVLEESLLELGHSLTPGAGLATLESILFQHKSS